MRPQCYKSCERVALGGAVGNVLDGKKPAPFVGRGAAQGVWQLKSGDRRGRQSKPPLRPPGDGHREGRADPLPAEAWGLLWRSRQASSFSLDGSLWATGGAVPGPLAALCGGTVDPLSVANGGRSGGRKQKSRRGAFHSPA